MPKIKIAPSILSADFACLYEPIREAEKGGADLIHIDVMDGRFVPNITIGALVVESIRKVTQLKFCVHLMVVEPEKQVRLFADAGANYISFHVEACPDCRPLIKLIRDLEKKPALALKPETPFSEVIPFLSEIDMLVIMTVDPGAGGQPLLRDVLPKIREARNYIDANGLNVLIEVDGGVKASNAHDVVVEGANILVAGSSVFRHPTLSIAEAIRELREKAEKA